MNEKILKGMAYLRDGYTEAAYELLEEVSRSMTIFPVRVSPAEFIKQAVDDIDMHGKPIIYAVWPNEVAS